MEQNSTDKNEVNIIEFAEKFLGYELYPYQKSILSDMVSKPYDNFVWASARQTGKSDITQAYITYMVYTTENYQHMHITLNHQFLLIFGRNLIQRCKRAGIVVNQLSKHRFSFENGGDIYAIPMSPTVILNHLNSMSVDEYEFLLDNDKDAIINSNMFNVKVKKENILFRILTKLGIKKPKYDTTKTKLFLISTPNIRTQKNSYSILNVHEFLTDVLYVKTTWEDVPNRDNLWKQELEKMLGKNAFKWEYNLGLEDS